MSPRRSKDIGTDAERAVVRYLQANGWPHAERRALRGQLDAGDIAGTPGICWEVKGGDAARAASDAVVDVWLSETEQERFNADAEFGVLVMQRAGKGPANAGRWWSVVTVHTLRLLCGDSFYNTAHYAQPVRVLLADLVALLHSAGYGARPAVTE